MKLPSDEDRNEYGEPNPLSKVLWALVSTCQSKMSEVCKREEQETTLQAGMSQLCK